MNCQRPAAPAGDLMSGSKPLSTIANHARSSGIERARSDSWISSRYRPLRLHHTAMILRPRGSSRKNSRYFTTRASQRTGMSGIFRSLSHVSDLPPTAGGVAGADTVAGGRPPPPPAASGPFGALGRSLGHGDP